MRTTIRIDDALLREAKQMAARTGKTLTAIIEDSLRETLTRQHSPVKREPVRLITGGEGGLRPGVNLDDSAGLLDIMDALDDSG
ncbi:MAG: ribbon-helix-helix protein, CopG family [Anaerolineales bacterium]